MFANHQTELHRVRPTALRPPPAPRAALPQPSAAACACGGSCPRCASASRAPRIHPSAPEVTTPLRARAATIGQDIFFAPGEYQPGTPHGDELIAHEVAHTRQTAQSAHASASTDESALEANADALATGDTDHALAAPADMALRTPLDGESADAQARRARLIEATSHAETNIITLLRTSGLVDQVEIASERGGVQGVILPSDTEAENFLSYPEREAMLRRIIRSLMEMATYYRTHPIPATLPPAERSEDGGFVSTIATRAGSSSYGGASDAWSQLQAAYELYLIMQGDTSDVHHTDWYYLTPTLNITRGAARGARRFSRGTPSGAYMVFPDINREPLRYFYLRGFEDIPRGSVIVEFWHDDIGYYYEHRGQRIDVPSPWSR